jgi:AcrR family transcriptional regulator
LRRELLQAAEAELGAKGMEGFSLRGVAKRAGVSHAAPAHHFGDTNGLLTALAADGYSRFVETQLEAIREGAQDPGARLASAGLGYVRFATANPALFRLIFSSDRPDYDDPELCKAAEAGYNLLVDLVEQASGDKISSEREAVMNIVAAWATAHGLADLLVSGRPKTLAALPESDRETMIREIVARMARID